MGTGGLGGNETCFPLHTLLSCLNFSATCRYYFFIKQNTSINKTAMRILVPRLWLKAVSLRLIMTPVHPCDRLGLWTG